MSNYKTYKKKNIINEYNQAASNLNEYEMVKWGSQEKMLNRFRFAMGKIQFNGRCKWLDVGCGTGAFQAMVVVHFPELECFAIDISDRLIDYASKRKDTGNTKFFCLDFMDSNCNGFDVITCIGVMQKTNIPINIFFSKAYSILNDGGVLYVDTKHLGWKEFNKPDFYPEKSHQWFALAELEYELKNAGLKQELATGFLPDVGREVLPEESHTIVIIATKEMPDDN